MYVFYMTVRIRSSLCFDEEHQAVDNKIEG